MIVSPKILVRVTIRSVKMTLRTALRKGFIGRSMLDRVLTMQVNTSAQILLRWDFGTTVFICVRVIIALVFAIVAFAMLSLDSDRRSFYILPFATLIILNLCWIPLSRIFRKQIDAVIKVRKKLEELCRFLGGSKDLVKPSSPWTVESAEPEMRANLISYAKMVKRAEIVTRDPDRHFKHDRAIVEMRRWKDLFNAAHDLGDFWGIVQPEHYYYDSARIELLADPNAGLTDRERQILEAMGPT